MSTATTVPVTHDLEGDDAIEALREKGRWPLARDAYVRFRYADGFSHARALAFQLVLTMIPALIAVVGFARVLEQPEFSQVLSQTIGDLAPGPAGETLIRALRSGGERTEEAGETALLLGLTIAIVSGATAMGQIERGANRIYGVERDRPSVRKYAVATALALSAGAAIVVAFVAVVAGDALGRALEEVTGWNDAFDTAWAIGRWPLGAALVMGAIALVFRVSPNRPQPDPSWLLFGSAIAVVLWFLFTAGLALYVSVSDGFGQTYGPLAGFIALMIWSFLTALALFFGLAVAAQLEAIRAGVLEPVRREEPRPVGRGSSDT